MISLSNTIPHGITLQDLTLKAKELGKDSDIVVVQDDSISPLADQSVIQGQFQEAVYFIFMLSFRLSIFSPILLFMLSPVLFLLLLSDLLPELSRPIDFLDLELELSVGSWLMPSGAS